jgi:hypothetical protein
MPEGFPLWTARLRPSVTVQNENTKLRVSHERGDANGLAA